MVLLLCLFGCQKEVINNELETHKLAERIVEEVGVKDKVRLIEDRLVPGVIFFDEDLILENALYIGENSADTVGVFRTNDVNKTTKFIQDYLKSMKEELKNQNPSESFKVDNAILEHNEDTVILIVAEDLEKAKRICRDALGD